jgi:hypothetical protein
VSITIIDVADIFKRQVRLGSSDKLFSTLRIPPMPSGMLALFDVSSRPNFLFLSPFLC